MNKLAELASILALDPQIRDDGVALITGTRAYIKPAFGRLHVIMRPAASRPIEAINRLLQAGVLAFASPRTAPVRPRIARTKSRVTSDAMILARPPVDKVERQAFRNLLGL